jgi:excisionase family DNA binding protein
MERRNTAVGVGEAARRLGVTTRTVQRWLRQGRLPAVVVGTRLKVDPRGLPGTLDSPAGAGAVRTLLVANRGEIVVRIAGTCRRLGVRCLALVTPDQQSAWWASQTDGQVRLDAGYLDGDAIVAAALSAGADAIHPGYGFLSENAAFAEAVEHAGLTWVGPPADAIRIMGDKAAARSLAARLGIPLLPGSDGKRQSDRALAAEADRIGYPVLVKPAGGGGGKGMHVARSAADLPELLARARREAAASFGDDRLLLERYLDRPRHVEIQVLFDASGRGVSIGERECSLQRRHQKVVEESPSPGVRGRAGTRLRDAMGAAAVRLAEAAGYRGVGTVEFLVDENGEFFFLEMNTRLQVEHPVTELVTGRDLVADQLAVASGRALGALGLDRQDHRDAGRSTVHATVTAPWRHAIEVRLYAEDPDEGYLPSGGRILALRWPTGDGVRVDAGVGLGDEVATRYDPLLAKIVVGGTDRNDAVERLRRALAETLVLGTVTNLGLLRWIAAADWFGKGETWTDTLDVRWHPAHRPVPDWAWRAAARVLAGAATATDGAPETVASGWRLNAAPRVRVQTGDEERSVETSPPAADEPPSETVSEPSGDRVVGHVDVAGRSVAFSLAAPPTVESAVRHAAHAGEGARIVAAPMPGRVLAVPAREGNAVELHEPLVILEAMKMENAVTATAAGTVARVLVRSGQQVQKGDVLVELEG